MRASLAPAFPQCCRRYQSRPSPVSTFHPAAVAPLIAPPHLLRSSRVLASTDAFVLRAAQSPPTAHPCIDTFPTRTILPLQSPRFAKPHSARVTNRAPSTPVPSPPPDA